MFKRLIKHFENYREHTHCTIRSNSTALSTATISSIKLSETSIVGGSYGPYFKKAKNLKDLKYTKKKKKDVHCTPKT